MKKHNVILAAVLALFIMVGLYTTMGVKMKVQASASATPSGIDCQLLLTNGSVLPLDYIEFIPLSPEGARITSARGEGDDLRPLSQMEASFTLTGADASGAQVEVGYYVLGMRRTVTVNIH